MRKHGLTVDNLVEAEVVTADGEIIRASATDHPELFWALRGGGGNFGVVSWFRFALHPVGPTVMAGPVFWAAEHTTDVLRFYREFVTDVPEALGNVIRLGTIPPLPVVDQDLYFRPAIAVASCYAGPVDDGERAVRALRRFGTPLVDLFGPPCTSITRAASTTPCPMAGAITGRRPTSPTCPMRSSTSSPTMPTTPTPRGRTRRCSTWVAQSPELLATPPLTRDADVEHNIVIDAAWLPDQDDTLAATETAWARKFFDALRPHRAGVYVNFLDSDDDVSRVGEAYGDATFRRLAEVKAKYDPDNVFLNNKNIPPARGAAIARTASTRCAHLGVTARRRWARGTQRLVVRIRVEVPSCPRCKPVPLVSMGGEGRLRVEVLGPIRASDGAGRDVTPDGSLQRRLLALLVLHRGRVVSADCGDRRVVAGATTAGPGRRRCRPTCPGSVAACLRGSSSRRPRAIASRRLDSTSTPTDWPMPSTVPSTSTMAMRWPRSTRSSSGGTGRRTPNLPTSTPDGSRRWAWPSCGSGRPRPEPNAGSPPE